jgi:hypothetical protein
MPQSRTETDGKAIAETTLGADPQETHADHIPQFRNPFAPQSHPTYCLQVRFRTSEPA